MIKGGNLLEKDNSQLFGFKLIFNLLNYTSKTIILDFFNLPYKCYFSYKSSNIF